MTSLLHSVYERIGTVSLAWLDCHLEIFRMSGKTSKKVISAISHMSRRWCFCWNFMVLHSGMNHWGVSTKKPGLVSFPQNVAEMAISAACQGQVVEWPCSRTLQTQNTVLSDGSLSLLQGHWGQNRGGVTTQCRFPAPKPRTRRASGTTPADISLGVGWGWFCPFFPLHSYSLESPFTLMLCRESGLSS